MTHYYATTEYITPNYATNGSALVVAVATLDEFGVLSASPHLE